GPVVSGNAGYVTPLYARHKHDGTITNTVAYPLTRALYGARVRQPIGGEFGFAAELAHVWLAEPVWDTDVARFGIDIFMTTTALAAAREAAESGDTRAISGDLWARAVYDILAATKRREESETLARALLPLYFARVAALIDEMKGLDHAGAEGVVEQQALAFERAKPY